MKVVKLPTVTVTVLPFFLPPVETVNWLLPLMAVIFPRTPECLACLPAPFAALGVRPGRQPQHHRQPEHRRQDL